MAPEGEGSGGGTALGAAEGAGAAAGAEAGSTPAEGAQAAQGGAEGQGEGAEATLIGKLYNAGKLRPEYQTILQTEGMEASQGYLGREGLGGNLDSTFKALLGLVPFTGKAIENWTPDQVAAMPDFQRNEMLAKLRTIPATPADYKFDGEDLSKLDMPDEFKGFVGDLAHKVGASQEQLEGFLVANQEWNSKQQEAAQAAQEEQMEVTKAEITGHFKGEWADNYAANTALVEGFVDQNLDLENPAHKALVHDKVGISMIYRLAKAELNGRSEPGAPALGDGEGVGAGGYQEQFSEFVLKHPDYTSDINPAIRAQGNRLRDMAFAEKQRNAG